MRTAGQRATLLRENVAFVWIALASLALKLGLALHFRDLACVMDECDYAWVARGLASGEGLRATRGYVWPPGYPAFLALCGQWGLPPLAGARIAQAFVSTATLPFVAWLAARVWSRRAALAAVALCAFDPTLVAFSHLGWPVTLFLLPFCAAIAVLLDPPRLDARQAVLAGALLGLAALVKAIALWFAPVAAVWVLVWGGRRGDALWSAPGAARRLRERLPAAAAVVLTTFAVIAPWSARNLATYDHFVWLDTTLGRNLSLGHDVPPPAAFDFPWLRHPRYQAGRRPECTDENPVLRERCERRGALAFVAANPWLTLARIPDKLADLYTPNSFALRHVRLGWYGTPADPRHDLAFALLFALPWMASAVAALAALCLRARGGLVLLGLLFAYDAAVHAATIGTSRFRMVIVPFVIVAGAPIWAGGAAALAESLRNASPWRRATFGVGLAAMAWLWSQRGYEVFAGR